MEVYNDQNGYRDSTFCWSNPKQRVTDGKYILIYCEEYGNHHDYTIEVSDPSWFQDPNEEP
jgi:hypothetical protein